MSIDLTAPIEPVRSLRTMAEAVRLQHQGKAAQVETWMKTMGRSHEEIQMGRIRAAQLKAAAELFEILALYPEEVRAIVNKNKGQS